MLYQIVDTVSVFLRSATTVCVVQGKCTQPFIDLDLFPYQMIKNNVKPNLLWIISNQISLAKVVYKQFHVQWNPILLYVPFFMKNKIYWSTFLLS